MKDLLMCLSLLLFAMGSVQAEIYKWIDQEGQVHYGEKPPENRKAKQVQIRSGTASTLPEQTAPSNSSTEDRLERQQKLLRSMREDRLKRKEEREREEKMAAQKKRNCGIARDRLRRYEASSRVYDVDEKGNRIFLPDSARQKTIERARNDVKRWCE